MSTITRRPRRTATDWDEFAREIIPVLRGGGRLSDPEIKERIGANVDAVRAALARQGVDSHGDALQLKAVEARSSKTLAKRVATRRKQGAPWWQVQAETGMTYSELRKLLTENDLWGEVHGRIRRG